MANNHTDLWAHTPLGILFKDDVAIPAPFDKDTRLDEMLEGLLGGAADTAAATPASYFLDNVESLDLSALIADEGVPVGGAIQGMVRRASGLNIDAGGGDYTAFENGIGTAGTAVTVLPRGTEFTIVNRPSTPALIWST